MPGVSRRFYVCIALLLAVGGWFGAMGAVAQGDASTVQPGGDLPGDPSVQLPCATSDAMPRLSSSVGCGGWSF